MKKFILTLILGLLISLNISAYAISKMDNDNKKIYSQIENVQVIKLYTPAIINIIDYPKHTPFFKVDIDDPYICKNLKYVVKDSLLEIKLDGDFHDYNLEDNRIKILVFNNNKNLKIVPSDDLVISNTKKYNVLNHGTKN